MFKKDDNGANDTNGIGRDFLNIVYQQKLVEIAFDSNMEDLYRRQLWLDFVQCILCRVSK